MSKSSVDPRAERAKLAAAVRETLIVANQLRRVAESYGSGPEAYDVAREAGDAYEAAFAAYAAHVMAEASS
jgi:hypothetical protein